MDKRQGYRGPLEHLKAEDIESFSKELQIEMEKTPIDEGSIGTGVVIEVDNIGDEVTVRIGNALGVDRKSVV